MNKLIRYFAISAAAVAASQAAPFMAVGDGAELFATGVLGVRADDNILLSKNGTKSDVIFDIAPGVAFEFGKNSQTRGSVTLVDTFSNYSDNSSLNTNLFNGDVLANYDDGKMKLGFAGFYHELNQNTVDVRPQNGKLVRRDISNVAANGEVGLSELTSVGAGVTFNHEDYHPVDYVDSDTLTVPLKFYYKWTPKIDVSLGYTYRDYQAKSRSALDSIDNFYNIGARGEFSPKLTGTFAVGYTERRFSGSSKNRSGLGLESTFAYELSPKSSVQFGAANSFDTGATGLQQKNTTGFVTFVSKLTEEWSVNAGVNYRSIGYNFTDTKVSRTDDYWEGTLGATYVVNANVKIIGAYVYRTYKSDISTIEFDNNVFSIAANIRY